MVAVRLLVLVVFICFCAAASNPSSTTDKVEQLIHPGEYISTMTDNRIVGGYNASIEDFPHQVSFIVTNSNNQSFFCGGSVISKRHILSAAHCLQNVTPSMIKLKAGSSWRKNGTEIPIKDVKTHPDYDKKPFDSDVGVMETEEPIEMSETIQAINLPEKGRPLVPGSMVSVSGWGKTRFSAQSIPEFLMAVEIPVVDHTLCSIAYSDVLTENEWCGGRFFFSRKGTCQGDSGGAATQDGLAVGIVSFGRGCGGLFSPSVFADIAAPTIRDFITEHTGL